MANRGLRGRALLVNDRNARTRATGIRPKGRRAGAKRLREEQDELLKTAGFVPIGTDNLWVKEGVYYGREAALQNSSSVSVVA